MQDLLRIVLRALREARKGNRRTLIDKLTAMNIYLQLIIRRLTREPARRRKRQTRRKQDQGFRRSFRAANRTGQ